MTPAGPPEQEELMIQMPVIDMAATGMNIKRLRKASGLSVRDLQDMFGFGTPQAIYKWQRGEAIPTIDNLMALGMIFDVPIEDIIVTEACRIFRRGA